MCLYLHTQAAHYDCAIKLWIHHTALYFFIPFFVAIISHFILLQRTFIFVINNSRWSDSLLSYILKADKMFIKLRLRLDFYIVIFIANFCIKCFSGKLRYMVSTLTFSWNGYGTLPRGIKIICSHMRECSTERGRAQIVQQ